MKYLLIFFIAFIVSNTNNAQKVLDSPFILEKGAVFSSEPYNFIEPYHIIPYSGEEYKNLYQEFFYLYKDCFLYSELEYTRVRMHRTILFNKNEQFSNNIKNTFWINESGSWSAYEDLKTPKKIEYDRAQLIDIQLQGWARQFVGFNLKAIKNDTNEYSRGKHWIQLFDKQIDTAFKYENLKYDDNGIVQFGKPYFPKEGFEVVSLSSFLVDVVLNRKVTTYADIDFTFPYTSAESFQQIKDSIITGVRLKEDYYVSIHTGKLTSSIIGFGLMGRDTTFGKELMWIYYPELRWEMYNKCTLFEDKIVNYEYLFDKHLFNGVIDSLEPLPSYSMEKEWRYDYDFSVKLDPLVAISIQHEIEGINIKNNGIQETNYPFGKIIVEYNNGIANGDISQYYPNGNICFKGKMKDGWCESKFIFNYPNGKVKALRNFKNGVLDGKQESFYENGVLYAVYEIGNDGIQALKRNYDDGTLLETGSFKHGVIHGVWKYRLKCSSEMIAVIKKSQKKPFYPVYEENAFEYKVEYTHEKEEYCPTNYYGELIEQICLKVKYINP